MGTYTTAIQKLYVAYFNRPADAAGLEWWEGVVAGANGDTSMISAAFAASNEYRTTFAGMSHQQIVRTVYTNLFGREGEADGVEYWANALYQGLMTIDAVVTGIAKGAQGTDLEAYENKVAAATAFTNALDTHPERTAYGGEEALAAAKAFTRTITDDASLAAAIEPAALAASVAAFVEASRTSIEFTLTANADTGTAFTGGGASDMFYAKANTLGAGDTLKGGGGYDTLYLNEANGAALTTLPAHFSTTSVEQFMATSGAGIGTATAAYDVSGHADMDVLWFTAKGAVNVKVGDHAWTNIHTTSGAVNVAGGTAISVNGNTGAATLTGNSISSVTLQNTDQDATIVNTTADHTLALGLNAVRGSTIRDDAATTVDMGSTILIAHPAWTTQLIFVAQVEVNLDMAKMTTLNIDNSGQLYLDTTALAGDDMLRTVTLKGFGSMSADFSGILPFTTFDASSYTGTNALKIASASNLSVKGGIGVDSIVMTAALAGTASVQLGASDDIYDFSQAAQAGARVDGGAGGNDTMIVKDAVLLNTEGQVFTNFETLVFSSGQGVYDLDKAGSVTRLDASKQLREAVEFVNGRANSSINLVAEATNYDLEGGQTESFVPHADIKFNLKDASGANDQLTISLTAVDGLADGEANGVVEAATIDASAIETIRLHSAVRTLEADNPATPASEAHAAIDYTNMVSYLRIDGTKSVVVTGDASLNLTSIYTNSVTLFDATAAKGNIHFAGVTNTSETELTRITYLGGSADDYVQGTGVGIVFQGNAGLDTILLDSYTNVADIVRFAKAGDSILVLDAANHAVVEEMDTIYHFESGVDKIDLSGLRLAAGANREGFATYSLASNNFEALAGALGSGAGFFNDGGTRRSLAFASHGGNDGWLLVDANGDGNYTGGVDMIINTYGNTDVLKPGDITWG